MAYLATNIFPADGVKTYWDFSFAGVNPDQSSGSVPYLYPDDVKALELWRDVDGNQQVATRIVLIDSNMPTRAVIVGAPVVDGRQVKIYRQTEIRFPLVDYRDRQAVSEFDLDLANRQAIFVAQETQDAARDNLIQDNQGNFDAQDRRMVNLAPGIDQKDAVNKGQLDTLVTAEVSRTIRVPIAETPINELPPATLRANSTLMFNSLGQPIVGAPVDGSIGSFAATLASPDGVTMVGNAVDARDLSAAGGVDLVGGATKATDLSDVDGVLLVGNATDKRVLASADGAEDVGYGTSTVALELDRLNDALTVPLEGNLASLFMQGLLPSVQMWAADSNGAGAGQPNTYAYGYLGRLTRSIMRAFDEGFGSTKRGYMYEAIMDPYLLLNSEPGWSITGPVEWLPNDTFGGVTGTLLKIPSGSYIELTGREVAQGKVFYKDSVLSDHIRITVNGVVAAEYECTSAGRTPSFNLAVGGAYIKPTDVIRVAPLGAGAELLLQGFRVMRAGASDGPIVYVAPQGSQGFDDFFDDERSVQLTDWMKDDLVSGYALLSFLLGTNHIVNTVGKQKSPTEYVASMDACIQKYRGKLPDHNTAVLLWVPPRPNQATFAPYEDYVAAIVEYARTRDYISLLRMDLSGIEGARYFTYNLADPAPNLHYNDYGHCAIAKSIADSIGVSIKTGWPTFVQPESAIPKVDATAKNTWTTTAGSYLGKDGFVSLDGVFVRNGATSVAFGNVGAAHIPADNVLTTMIDDQGVLHTVVIRPVTGQLELVGAVTGITNLFTTGACRYKLI